MKYRVLYNPLAGLGKEIGGLDQAKKLMEGKDAEFSDVTKEGALDELFSKLEKGDKIVLCGGDGTLNKFVNSIPFIPENEILYYPTGNGNDFYRDVAEGGDTNEPCKINPYIVNLPTVAVNGRTCKFLNNVGFGIDGYCCETGDRLHREAPDKKVSYSGIAVKGLLFHFKPVNATVNVDGEIFNYKHVWLAPTMNGTYYGGGMMPTPLQKRLNDDGTVSVMIMHGKSKLKTLMVFPSIFKGTHVNHKKAVEVKTGKVIEVKFDRPTALQIDGETVTNVTEYRVTAAGAEKGTDCENTPATGIKADVTAEIAAGEKNEKE